MDKNTEKTGAVAMMDGHELYLIDRISKAIIAAGEGKVETLYRAALEQNPDLGKCTADSLIGALLQTLQLGLGLDHVSLVPLRERGAPVYVTTGGAIDEAGYECHFRLTYEGYAELARRAGKEAVPAGGAV